MFGPLLGPAVLVVVPHLRIRSMRQKGGVIGGAQACDQALILTWCPRSQGGLPITMIPQHLTQASESLG